MKILNYIGISEAAKIMGVSTNTLRNWEKKGQIKVYFHPVNGYRLYKMEDLQEILDGIGEEKK